MKYLILCLTIVSNILVAETFDVSISNFKFTPNDLTIKVGDTVRWTNNGGFHDVTEDNNVFSSGAASSSTFVFEHTFTSVQEVLYYCTVHSTPGRDINQFMNGRIVVEALEEPFQINQGISGAWFFSETSGSGLLLDLRPSDKFIFAAWFTYDTAQAVKTIGSSDNRWLTASGKYENDKATDMELFHTSGGLFDNSQSVSTEQVGTMTIEFSDCNTGTVNYSIPDENLTGSFPIQRVLAGTESLCENLSNNAEN